MATGNWLLSGVKGKVGDLVLSKSNGVQITRARNRFPSNPKTTKQALQRIKFAAIAAFYSAFEKDILNHSWQGVKYGGPSHNHFYKLALSPDIKTPAIEKGSMSFVPSNYPMSRGTLRKLDFDFYKKDDEGTMKYGITIPLKTSDLGFYISEVIDEFIKSNPYFAGKQLTFVLVGLNNGKFVPRVARLILNKEAYTELDLSNTFADINGYKMSSWTDSEGIGVFSIKSNGVYLPICAASVIVSEWNGKQWCRSNSDMIINEDVMPDEYFNGDVFSNALATYMNKEGNSSNTSDKFLNGAGNVPENELYPISKTFSRMNWKTLTIDQVTYYDAVLEIQKFIMSDASEKYASTTVDNSGKPVYMGQIAKIRAKKAASDTTFTATIDITWQKLFQISTNAKDKYENNLVVAPADWFNVKDYSK